MNNMPVVPEYLEDVEVVNKTIVYSDNNLNLEETNENLVKNVIYCVKENQLEECLKIILESNKDVVFDTIQYSKHNEEVHFYTNKDISIEEWNQYDNESIKYRYSNSNVVILEEIKKLLTNEKPTSSNCISLYDIYNVIDNRNNQIEKEKEVCTKKISKFINKQH